VANDKERKSCDAVAAVLEKELNELDCCICSKRPGTLMVPGTDRVSVVRRHVESRLDELRAELGSRLRSIDSRIAAIVDHMNALDSRLLRHVDVLFNELRAEVNSRFAVLSERVRMLVSSGECVTECPLKPKELNKK
jgi:hypothetical protein